MLINLQKMPKSMNYDEIMEGYSLDPLGVEKTGTVDKIWAKNFFLKIFQTTCGKLPVVGFFDLHTV